MMKLIIFSLILLSFNAFALLEFNGISEIEAPFTGPGLTSTFTVPVINIDGVDSATNVTAAIAGTEYDFLGGSYPGLGGDCPVTISAGLTCNLMLEFAPLTSGDKDDTLTIGYDFPILIGTVAHELIGKIDGHSETVGTGTCPAFTPVITTAVPGILATSSTISISVSGNNFSPTTTVSVPGLTTGALSIADFNNLSFNLTSDSTTSFYDLTITNECGSATVSNAFEVRSSTWLDLRIPGDLTAANPVFTTAGISGYTIDPTFGMQVTMITSNWLKLLRFDGACGAVTQDFDIVIYRQGDVSRFMPSLWNSATVVDPYPGTNTYQRQYIGVWENGSQSVNRVYGTQLGEGGSSWSQGFAATSVVNGGYYRYHFTSAGQTGNAVEIWSVDSSFNDISLLRTFVSNKPVTGAVNVCPGITPFDAGITDYYITAVRVL